MRSVAFGIPVSAAAFSRRSLTASMGWGVPCGQGARAALGHPQRGLPDRGHRARIPARAVTVPIAEPAALVAMKCVSVTDPGRGDRRATDLLDIWRLLADDPVAAVDVVEELARAPGNLPDFVGARLTGFFEGDPGGLIAQMAGGPGAPVSVEDVRDLWSAVIGPKLGR